ncbi:asparagine synthase (glutamine-hydrolyzing) [Streptomyces sp. IMTB 2501]|uniref:asparagine synthase (glutamine-hydrolyzing) n=1 Tax=Streptomyces sp. IMTB 2501 TaxID=1776340 RepID=UPI00096D4263|nr:asparagine synthase (glutamine-hydrolyzing) [Streptomyces sp. IMTB 2501]OLZ60610.1 asparagine synthase (glutamine-hydrolyzing) [Streptomyces sp. IMTB 2501]
MCGITGWIDYARDLSDQGPLLTAMAGTMACRGPDGAGVWLSRHAALGHRRLALVDLEGGGQPMTTLPAGAPADGTPPAVLLFSGEVYNHGELRGELVGRGHAFRSRSDTEVVLRAYLEWGERSFERLVGMYAFALWDTRTETLLLVRDRLGIKPLYWTRRGDGVLFGSEPKAVLAHPDFPAEVDAEGLAALFTVAIKPPGAGVYRDLHEVRPGHVVRVDRTGVHHRRYWQLASAPHTDDLPATIAEVRRLLADAVGMQLESDVPLVALLSGGIDSSALVGLAAQCLAKDGGRRLATYALDFVGSETDFKADALHVSRDAPFVRAVAGHVGTDHTDVAVETPSLVGELGPALRARDMPGVGDLDVSLLMLFREVRRHAAVALSGEGADDFFGGYPWFLAEAERPTGNFPWSAGVKDRNSQLSPQLREVLDLDAYVADTYATALAQVPRLDGESGVDRRLREVFHLQITRFLPFLLDRKDRMSMAHGLEVRVPFCDHRLVEYLWNVPWEYKRTGGQEKGLLREAVADLLPAQVVRRPKSGFPFGHSPAYLEAIRRTVRTIIGDPAAPVLGLVNVPAVRAMVDSDAWFSGDFTPPPWLPRLIQLDLWLREYGVRVVL